MELKIIKRDCIFKLKNFLIDLTASLICSSINYATYTNVIF